MSHWCGFYEIHTKPKTPAHSRTAKDCFETKAFLEGKLVGFYNDTLIKETLLDVPNALRSYKRVKWRLLVNGLSP